MRKESVRAGKQRPTKRPSLRGPGAEKAAVVDEPAAPKPKSKSKPRKPKSDG